MRNYAEWEATGEQEMRAARGARRALALSVACVLLGLAIGLGPVRSAVPYGGLQAGAERFGSGHGFDDHR